MQKYDDITINELQRVVSATKCDKFGLIEICEILDILSNDSTLLNGIKFETDYSVPFSAGVESDSGNMIINPDIMDGEINVAIRKQLKKYDIKYTELYNYMVLFYLLHETTHIIQQIPNLNDEVLNKINELICLKVQTISQTKLDLCWNNLSYEHHANVLASRTLLDIYNNDSNLRHYANFFARDYESLGYSGLFKIDSPIRKTGKILNIDELSYFDFSRYSLEDRILYGFDISKDEYKELIKEKNKCKQLINRR